MFLYLKKPLVFISFFCFSIFSGISSTSASGVRFPNPQFLKHFRPLGPVPFYGLPDSTADLGPFRKYELIRDPQHGWLLLGDGNGQVWALDHDSAWVRQDSTDCIGYNFSAYLLPGPMKFGGIGIWRSNGYLIQYIWESYEWETIQLSREIPIAHSENCFYSPADSLFFLLGAEYTNQGIKRNNTLSDSMYCLDFHDGVWRVLGKATEQLKHHVGQALFLSGGFAIPNGILFRSADERKLIALNFVKGEATVIGGDNWMKLWELGPTSYSTEKVIVSDSVGLYSMNPRTYEILDTLTYAAVFSKAESSFPLYEKQEKKSDLFSWAIGLALLPLLFFYFFHMRKRNSKSTLFDIPIQKIPVKDSPSDPSIRFKLHHAAGNYQLNGKNLNGLTSKEKQLIKVLVERRFSGEPLSTTDFNELLDIGQRSMDNQKKIRSEVVRNLNRLFRTAGFPGEAILRSRQEDDRRAIAYELSAEIEPDAVLKTID